jgi:hypothetical protein
MKYMLGSEDGLLVVQCPDYLVYNVEREGQCILRGSKRSNIAVSLAEIFDLDT